MAIKSAFGASMHGFCVKLLFNISLKARQNFRRKPSKRVPSCTFGSRFGHIRIKDSTDSNEIPMISVIPADSSDSA